jgi:site-specific DNA recombinase
MSQRPRLTRHASTTPKTAKELRCAIYTRKSTEEGLEQEFNSLDAQWEAASAYIQAQRHEGWLAVATRYDDGGCTGANLERPALQRLVADIEAGLIDCVVVYKVDRLSRSLLDFARLIQVFDTHSTSFVSVTQQFHTGSSMGRLVLNVLLSFAQFERELISERTRDKIAATRRKGLWTGGRPVLGYTLEDVNHQRRLVIMPDEAERVRAIFQLYLDEGSLLPVVQELTRRGWCNKAHTRPDGTIVPGKPFTRTSLHQMLTNVTYTGVVRYRDELHPGQHQAIVGEALWQAVQERLARPRGQNPPGVRNASGALLRGLLRCAACDAAMTPTHAKKGHKRYRYYACVAAQKSGHAHCPRPTLPAEPVEEIVLARIAALGQDSTLQDEVLAHLARQQQEDTENRQRDERFLRGEIRSRKTQVEKLTASLTPGHDNSVLLKTLQQLQAEIEDRHARLEASTQFGTLATIDEAQARLALTQFTPVWDQLTLAERERLLHALVAQVDHHPESGRITLTLRPTLIATLAEEIPA